MCRFKTGIFVFGFLGCTSTFFLIHQNIESWDLILPKWDLTIFPVYESDGIMGFLNVSLGCTPKYLPID